MIGVMLCLNYKMRLENFFENKCNEKKGKVIYCKHYADDYFPCSRVCDYAKQLKKDNINKYFFRSFGL